jgi:voltage-gated potassium channel
MKLKDIKKLVISILDRPAVKATLVILALTVIGALVVEVFESGKNEQFQTFWDSVWWVFVTITTVGYGDKVPLTTAGRIISVGMMFVGIAMLSVITATISSHFVTKKIKEGQGLEDIKLKEHILICGWNPQGEQILSTLTKEGSGKNGVVLINQLSEEVIADLLARFRDINLKFVRGDFTRENILSRANVKSASSAIILPDTSSGIGVPGDERTILATLSLKTLNPKIKVFAHIVDRENLSHLRKARADEVIVSDSYTGYLLANYIAAPGVPQFFEQLIKGTLPYDLIRRTVPDELVGKPFTELKKYYSKSYEGLLLGIGQQTEPFALNDLLSDDYSYLDEYIKRKFEEAGRGIESNDQVKISINPGDDFELSKHDFYLALEKKSS